MVKGIVLVSACAVIEGKNHEVLLMQEGDLPYSNWWVLPGGYIRPDETIEKAVAREFEEETGLKIASTTLIGLYEDFLTQKCEPVNHIIVAYKAEVVGGRIIFSKEAVAYKWLSIDQALSYPEIPQVFKRILADFDKKRKKGFWVKKR